MTRRLPILGLALGFAIFLAACGSTGTTGTAGSGSSGGAYGSGTTYNTTPAQTPAATTAPTQALTTPASASTVIVSQNMNLGSILTDAHGRTLYYFLPEQGGHVVCAGACVTYWPVASAATASAGGGVTGQLALITRPDGATQLSYNTWPLYYFAGDSGPDQTHGQGVVGFGGKWLVATPGLHA